jgi:glycine/D-amino acid oxidase-like deaminating enzyme
MASSRRCVVVGAGVLGASVAARLASAGWRVTLLERDQPGRGTSRWSFAWLNSNDKAPRPYHDLNHAGIRAWAELAPDLDGGAWYRPVGHLELATAGLQARVRRLTEWGYPARLVDPAEAADLEPALRLRVPGAWFPEEGYLLTEPLIARLVASATSHGAEVRTGEPGRVTAVEAGPDAAPAVRTADGAEHQADEVVCCAGRWTPALAPVLARVPLIPWDTRGSIAPGLVVRVGPVGASGPVRLLHTPELSLRPHPGGLLHLEAPDVAVDLHTPEAELSRWADELLRRARRTVRGLDDARVVETKVCARPLPADGQSIVGRLRGANGLYVAVTHSGVTLAAQLSRLIATDLTTGTPPAPLAPYSPARFGPARRLPGGPEA